MGFSRQGYWRGLTHPSPGDLADPGIEPGSPAKWDRTFKSGIPFEKNKVPWCFLQSRICGMKIMLTVLVYGVFHNEGFSSSILSLKTKAKKSSFNSLARQGWSYTPGSNTGAVFTPSSRESSAGKRAPEKKSRSKCIRLLRKQCLLITQM